MMLSRGYCIIYLFIYLPRPARSILGIYLFPRPKSLNPVLLFIYLVDLAPSGWYLFIFPPQTVTHSAYLFIYLFIHSSHTDPIGVFYLFI